MKWEEINQQHCSVARSLAEIGDRWTLLIVRDAIMGARKFEDYLQRTGAARNIVADRLKKLCESDILEKIVYQQKPDRYEYRLTDKGKDLYPLLVSLLAWGDKWHADDKGLPIVLTHKSCGHETHAVPHCSVCGDPLVYGSTRAALRNPAHPYWKTDKTP